jgi:CpeT/CpcT family (DUF1001)
MKKLKAYFLTVVLSILVVPSRAVALAPPIDIQVKEVAQWFTGLFDNTKQVESNPTAPVITMSNCSVELTDNTLFTNSQNIYLEQKSSAFERIRFYSFSEGNSGVNLNIRSFANNDILRGLCNQPKQQRIIDINNIVATVSCDISLIWDNNRYVGNNNPNGCSTSFGGKVVSSVTFFANGIDSLDQIFNANGNLLVSTPIEFRRSTSIPEPSFILGMIAIGIWGSSSISKKAKSKSLLKIGK